MLDNVGTLPLEQQAESHLRIDGAQFAWRVT
jgi:hypothetical protein